MMDRRVVVSLLAAAIALGACGKKAPPPQPQPTVDSAAIRAARAADSAKQAQEEAARRAAAEAQAAADAAAAALTRAKAAIAAPIYFDFDQALIRDEDKAALDQKVAFLRSNADLQLRIEGNADERGSDEYNLALGMRRAAAAKQYITGFGIDASRLSTMTNGEAKPVDPGHDEAAWAKNRRDDFIITAGGERITTPAAK